MLQLPPAATLVCWHTPPDNELLQLSPELHHENILHELPSPPLVLVHTPLLHVSPEEQRLLELHVLPAATLVCWHTPLLHVSPEEQS